MCMNIHVYPYIGSSPVDRTAWRITNAGSTGWRPDVKVRFYSDTACTALISVPDSAMVTISGSENNVPVTPQSIRGYSSWRPQCHPCSPGEIWLAVKFPSQMNVLCVDATNMGSGSGAWFNWNGGVVLQVGDGADGWIDIGSPIPGSNRVKTDREPCVTCTPGKYLHSHNIQIGCALEGLSFNMYCHMYLA
jgi:hypothetical protein